MIDSYRDGSIKQFDRLKPWQQTHPTLISRTVAEVCGIHQTLNSTFFCKQNCFILPSHASLFCISIHSGLVQSSKVAFVRMRLVARAIVSGRLTRGSNTEFVASFGGKSGWHTRTCFTAWGLSVRLPNNRVRVWATPYTPILDFPRLAA